jgi:putative endonuclease
MADRAANARRGKSGESHARVWLEGRGYTTVAANWRCPSGELDLVMLHRDELVFVEVKTRTGERFGRAAEAVTPAKQRKLLTTAAWFASEHPEHEDRIWRIDIVAVTIDPRTGAASVEHIENAVVEG